jgi:hypothetical protein
MARVSLTLPDELLVLIRTQSPRVNLSGVLQEGLRARLKCDHREVTCVRCAAPFGRRELVDEELGRFYGDAMWELGELARRAGTAEGAARILHEIAERHSITKATFTSLPRPSRAAREAARQARNRSEGIE